eukprot:s1_g2078.t1
MEKLGVELGSRIEHVRDYEAVDVDVFLKTPTRANLENLDVVTGERPRAAIVSDLKRTASESQADFLGFVSERSSVAHEMDGFGLERAAVQFESRRWINNSVALRAPRDEILRMMEREDVEHIEVAHHAELQDLIDEEMDWSTSDKVLLTDSVTTAWSVEHVNAHRLWQLGITGKNVVCAVIDTGVNYNHPDLVDRMWKGSPDFPKHGYDFENRTKDPLDDQGHGTACAGIVAGSGKLGLKTGVAPGATIMALKVGGVERNYWDALAFAIDNGADVISMSMSWKYTNSPDYPGWRRACESVLEAGVLHANSIGNQGDNLTRFPLPYNIAAPGNCPPPRLHSAQNPAGGVASVISCGATDSADHLAGYSGRGPAAWEALPYDDYPYDGGTEPGLIKPDLCAPGPGTRSCNWIYRSGGIERPYRGFGGTSAATPHIGGVLCLLASAIRAQDQTAFIKPAEVQEALENTAVRVQGQALDKENHYGAGRVDVYAAYQYGQQKGYWS